LAPNQPHNQWLPGALSMGLKRPEREANHLCSDITKLEDVWSYTHFFHTSS